MKETKNITAHAGNPLTLLGEHQIVGNIAPEFTGVNGQAQPVNLADFKGKTIVIASLPSVDTGVCAAETREFNKRVTELGNDVVVLTISKDLPFALGRFCAAEGIKNVHTLSDYVSSDFGMKYGVLIKENMLLARAIFVVDKTGKLAYIEYVSDLTKEPDYDTVISKVKAL